MSSIEWGYDPSQPTDEIPPEPALTVAPDTQLLITHSGVRERIDRRNSSMPHERIAALMIYAFEAKDETREEVQPDFMIELTVDLASFVHGWLRINLYRMYSVTRDEYEKRWHDEDCDEKQLEDYSWIRNIRRIHAMQRLNDEAILARLSVETIFIENLDNKTA